MNAREHPTPVIVNAAAGTGWDEKRLEELDSAFREAGMEVNLLAARDGDEIRSHAQAARKSGGGILVAGGGDGTISTVAAIAVEHRLALGILPLGTLNHFAKDLGIPMDMREAVQVVARGRMIEVDVGEVGGRIFINNSSLGIYPDIVRDRTRQQRRLGRGKRWALVWATLTALKRSSFLRLRITLDGRERAVRTPFIFIGNNAYIMEGFDIGKREGMQDGRLSVYFTRRCSRLGLIGLGFRALFGRLTQARDFEAVTAQRLVVDSGHRALRVAADGEVFGAAPPLEYRMRPLALKVIVP
jgi:diacylglycerol kinase family enzyme